MLTYGLLTAAALYLAYKWVFLHRCKTRAVPDQEKDAELIGRLNERRPAAPAGAPWEK